MGAHRDQACIVHEHGHVTERSRIFAPMLAAVQGP